MLNQNNCDAVHGVRLKVSVYSTNFQIDSFQLSLLFGSQSLIFVQHFVWHGSSILKCCYSLIS